MKNSCGAIFYSYDLDGRLGIILGEEGKNEWLPFKGCANEGETFEQAAIREIKEETCGLVELSDIVLEHRFSSKRKNYFIGLCYVSYSIIKEFEEKVKTETRKEFKEKRKLGFFPLDTVLYMAGIHSITKSSIEYYWDRLNKLNNSTPEENNLMRCHGVTVEYAQDLRNRAEKDLIKRSTKILDTSNKKMNILLFF